MAVSLAAMIVGLALVRAVEGAAAAAWVCFFILTALHLFFNYKACNAVNLATLSAERCRVIVAGLKAQARVPTPAEVPPDPNLFF
jgi:hypothetical protein